MELYESDLEIKINRDGREGFSKRYKNKAYTLKELQDGYEKIKPVIEKITGKPYLFNDFLKKNGHMYLMNIE